MFSILFPLLFCLLLHKYAGVNANPANDDAARNKPQTTAVPVSAFPEPTIFTIVPVSAFPKRQAVPTPVVAFPEPPSAPAPVQLGCFDNAGSSEGIVTACSEEDFTPENWGRFRIDDYLAQFITQFGATNAFPQTFVNNQLAARRTFSCAAVNDQCKIQSEAGDPLLPSPQSTTDCVFSGLESPSITICSAYIAPQAAFVVRNWERMHEVIKDVHSAVGTATNVSLCDLSEFLLDTG
jgi:hypothetical protein